MLDPCSSTRATITEVLTHPWLNPLPRKTSLQLPVELNGKRRIGISHSQSIALEITKSIIAEVGLTCSCWCHTPGRNRDSAVVLHCEECEPISQIKHPNRRISICFNGKSTSSICSSGYSSSSESLVGYPPILSKQTSTVSNKSLHMCLKPQNGEDFDIVFV